MGDTIDYPRIESFQSFHSLNLVCDVRKPESRSPLIIEKDQREIWNDQSEMIKVSGQPPISLYSAFVVE